MYRRSMSDDSHPLARWRQRQEPRLSQDDLGGMIGVDGMTVSRWERSKCQPRPSHLKKLRELTGLSTDQILSQPAEAES